MRSVVQAEDGYLWVATAEGLVRFDGSRFTGFDLEPDAALARLSPRWLFPLPDGTVWVATGRGGLLRWGGRRLSKVWDEAELEVPFNQIPQVLQVVSDGRNGAYIVCGTEVWHVSPPRVPEPVSRTPEIEDRLRKDAQEWGKRGRPLTGSADVKLLDRKGRTWAAMPTGAIVVTYPDGTTEEVSVSDAATAGRVAQLQEDREGNIWAAAGEGGLIRIRERRASVLTTADGLSDNSIMTLIEDHSGALWVAGRHGGLDRIQNEEITHFHVGEGRVSRPVSAICEDRFGTLWVGTRHGSVFRFLENTFRPMENWPKAVAIVEDQAGRLWFGGQQGLAAMDSGKLTRYGVEEGFTASEVTSLVVDSSDQIWVGSSSGLVFQGKSGRFKMLGEPDSLSQHRVSALLMDADGTLWGSTLGGGMFHWKQDRYTRFSTAEGLPDARLTAVIEDRGYFWIGSLAGIFRVSKTELLEIEQGKRHAAQWLQLDRSDGMLSRECTGGNHPTVWRGKDGRIWFPTVNGVVYIRPDQLDLNTTPPTVVIEQCRANGRLLDTRANPVKVGPGRSRLEFRYTGLNFTAPGKVRFRVHLEGLEGEWRDVGAQRVAAYEAVPSGEYRFRVRAMNGDGVWDEAGASVAVQVLPHIWETAWFRVGMGCLAGAVAVGVGWGVARARMRRRLEQLQLQTAREKERARIAQDLHDDLGASLTEISMLAHLATEERHENDGERSALPEIASKAHALVGALDEIVWAVNPRHDTLASLADYLAAFAAEFLDTAGIVLRLEIARNLPEVPLDTEQRHGVFLAVREALNNVVKHSDAAEVWLRLRIEQRLLEITIEDNGHGFSSAASDLSDGLRNMRQRLMTLGGECRIDSTAGRGTSVCFSLLLP
ncbi:sensor histidine kinase [Verrucomicrobiota bacterium sgz303538]